MAKANTTVRNLDRIEPRAAKGYFSQIGRVVTTSHQSTWRFERAMKIAELRHTEYLLARKAS